MTPELLHIRIQQLLSLKSASGCSRRQFAAMLLSPAGDILTDGHNTAPHSRYGAKCGGNICLRDGYKPEEFSITKDQDPISNLHSTFKPRPFALFHTSDNTTRHLDLFRSRQGAEDRILEMCEKTPPRRPGEDPDIGCFHAELSALTTAARRGVSTNGSVLLTTSEPSLGSAKVIAASGVRRVMIVLDGAKRGKRGVEFLRSNSVLVEFLEN